jgi:hypothetical protein
VRATFEIRNKTCEPAISLMLPFGLIEHDNADQLISRQGMKQC